MSLDIALNWYAYPFNASHWDALARTIGERLIGLGFDASVERFQGDTQVLLSSGDLALVQCCGIDAWRHQTRVRPIATPVFAGGDDTGHYASVVLVRKDGPLSDATIDDIYKGIETSETRVAANQRFSWSGSLVARHEMPEMSLACWQSWPETGGHRASVQWLIDGRADVVFLDEISWSYLSSSDEVGQDQIFVAGRTSPMPRCPLVVPQGRSDLEAAVRTVLAELKFDDVNIEGFFFEDPAFWLTPFEKAAKAMGLKQVGTASC